MARRCGKCGLTGHYKSTCGTQTQPTHNIPKGHQILAEQNKKVDRVEDETGNIPKKGLWVLSPEKKKIYGQILYVKRSGEIVWQSIMGANVESSQQMLLENKCIYGELEPIMLRDWKMVNLQ